MSYRLKLTVIISLLIAISFGIGGTLMITTSFSASLEKEIQAALDSFETVQSTLYLLNSLGEQTDFDSLSNALRQMENQRVGAWQALSLTAPDETLFQSGSSILLSFDLPEPQENQCTYLPVKDQFGHGLVVKALLSAGDTVLTLAARFDLSDVYATRDIQQRQYLIVYTAVMVFGILSSVVLSSALTVRLRRLTRTVRRISGGDLSKRSRLNDSDEFGQLSRDFDAMADKLQENISHLEAEMERQEQFMGAFAHELKTPMTSIIGFADLLRQGNLDENTRMMAAEYIYNEGHRLERLSFKLLELLLLKKDELQLKQVWLGNFLGEIERTLEPGLKARDIRLVCRAQQVPVVLEPDLVKSLLYNLVDNAAKAMDGSGLIVLMGGAVEGGCQFQVVDNGRGMEEKDLKRITEAFYRVDKARSRSQGGAGLGLALCKQIVQLHDGTIHFASEPGKGTRITVTLYGKAGGGDA